MNKPTLLPLAIVAALCSPLAASDDAFPAINGYGNVVAMPDAATQPDKHAQYKTVFDVTSGAELRGVNRSLFRVARAVNVFASAGVPLSHLHFVAVISGPATPVVLDNEHYHAKFGKDNPNLDLIAKLKSAGVDVQVCGQALHGLHLDPSWVDPHVTVALSALSTEIIYGNRGYAYIGM